jgi:hypothetical protein
MGIVPGGAIVVSGGAPAVPAAPVLGGELAPVPAPPDDVPRLIEPVQAAAERPAASSHAADFMRASRGGGPRFRITARRGA